MNDDIITVGTMFVCKLFFLLLSGSVTLCGFLTIFVGFLQFFVPLKAKFEESHRLHNVAKRMYTDSGGPGHPYSYRFEPRNDLCDRKPIRIMLRGLLIALVSGIVLYLSIKAIWF